jgi:hypothetical protein
MMTSSTVTCRAGEVGGDEVGGVPIEGDAGAVVAHRRSRVGVGCDFLHIAQGYAGVEGGSEERVAQAVWSDGLIDSGPAGDSANDPAGAVSVHPLTVGTSEDRAVESFANGQVDRPGGARRERDRDDLAAVGQDGEGPVPAFEAKGFGDPQAVDR